MIKIVAIVLFFLGYGAVINYYEHSASNAYAVGTKGSDFCKKLLGSKRAARGNVIKFRKWLKKWRGTSGVCYVRIGLIADNTRSKKLPYTILGDNIGHKYQIKNSWSGEAYLNIQAPVSAKFAENAEVGDVVKFKVRIANIDKNGYMRTKSQLID